MFDTDTLNRDWGDPATNALAKAVAELLKQDTFALQRPLTLRNYGSGPAIDILQNGNSQHRLISGRDSEGRVVQLGFGAACRGIVANEFVPDTNFALDPTIVNELFSTQGNVAHEADGSRYSEGRSGTGVAHTKRPFVPVAGWAEALTSLQKSNDTEHAPDSAVKLTRDGQKYWWPTYPAYWQHVRCLVTAVNADTLTCLVVAKGKVTAETITVAKPVALQQTLWDGQTVGGYSYTYTDSQHRTRTVSGSSSQVVEPLYATDEPRSIINAVWVGNQTNLAGVGWIDANVDARHFACPCATTTTTSTSTTTTTTSTSTTTSTTTTSTTTTVTTSTSTTSSTTSTSTSTSTTTTTTSTSTTTSTTTTSTTTTVTTSTTTMSP